MAPPGLAGRGTCKTGLPQWHGPCHWPGASQAPGSQESSGSQLAPEDAAAKAANGPEAAAAKACAVGPPGPEVTAPKAPPCGSQASQAQGSQEFSGSQLAQHRAIMEDTLRSEGDSLQLPVSADAAQLAQRMKAIHQAAMPPPPPPAGKALPRPGKPKSGTAQYNAALNKFLRRVQHPSCPEKYPFTDFD